MLLMLVVMLLVMVMMTTMIRLMRRLSMREVATAGQSAGGSEHLLCQQVRDERSEGVGGPLSIFITKIFLVQKILIIFFSLAVVECNCSVCRAKQNHHFIVSQHKVKIHEYLSILC